MTQIIAHRGASRLERENTIAAFRRAVALGADGVELDVRRSADGELVVHHDPRLADGRVIVETPSHDLPGDIPTLSAALDACAGVAVNIEIKNDPNEPDHDPTDVVAERVATVLADRSEPIARWLVSSFRPATVARVRAVAPAIPTALLTLEGTDAELATAADAGHVAVNPWVLTLTAEHVAAAHRRGLRVYTWTCNETDRAREVAGWGVDGIVTDVPDVIGSALGRPAPA